MALINFRQMYLPYCLQKQEDGTWLPLNREYRVLGFDDGHDHSTARKRSPRFKLTDRQLQSLRWDKEPVNKTDQQVWLYNDGCRPEDSEQNMTEYMRRLSVLLAMKGSG